jgi:hypothetical protein
MSVNDRIDSLKALSGEVERLQRMARLERITSWVSGNPSKAAEYTQKARELETLHTRACHHWNVSISARIQAALKAGCFVLGFAIAAGC